MDQLNFYNILKDTIPLPLYYQDKNAILVDCNIAFLNFFSIKKNDSIGRSIYEIMPQEFSVFLEKSDMDLCKNQGTKIDNISFKIGDNEFLDIIINRSTVPDNKGNTIGIFGIIQDISEVREKELELKKLSLAVEYSPASVIITDTKGNIEYANPKFTELTGYSLDDIKGKNPNILKSGEQSDDFYKNMWETIKRGDTWHGNFHNIKKDGESYWEQASISAIKNKHGEIMRFIAIKEDITERKKAEDALRISEERLRARNQIIEKELQIARLTQRELIIVDPPEINFLDIYYQYLPMEEVGGDYFTFHQYNDNSIGVLICDISGHGVSAALFVAMIKSTAERLFKEFGNSPSEYLNQLNMALTGYLTSNFITGIYGLLQKSEESGEIFFKYSNGGHPHPLIIKSNGKISSCTNRDTIIGFFPEKKFTEETVKLEKGDRIFLYTDGIPEAVNEEKEIIGYDDELISFFNKSKKDRLVDTMETILQNVKEFRGNAQVEDDVVLIGFEVK